LLEGVASEAEHTRVVVDHIVQIVVAQETSCVHLLLMLFLLIVDVGIVVI